MNDYLNNHYEEPTPEFPEVRGKTTVIAFMLGMMIIAAAIILGRSYAFYVAFLAFSFVITFVWSKSPLPWIFLVSIVAASPIPLFRQQFACNLMCALWFTIFNMRYLSKLPTWIYLLTGLAICGFITSSIEWIGGNAISALMRQGAFAFNFLLAPFILIPMIYCRMRESRDTTANLQGLLFCLIVPSTFVLLSAKLFGSVANAWEASLHEASQSEGYLQFQLGKALVSFQRTDVGFIFAALICASTAVVISQVKMKYRILAGVCLISNLFLMLTTISFGSIFSCFCGLAVIFTAQLRVINVGKWLMSVTACVCLLFLTYGFSPPSVKGYLAKRVEFRVKQGKEQDRFEMWVRGVNYYLEHPGGVGFTLSVGEREKTVIHNDYLAYMVSYSIMGGLAYTGLIAGLLTSFFRMRKRILDDPSAFAIYLAGSGVIVAAAVNSMTDHMSANRWYFNVIWSVIWYSYFCSRSVQREAFPEETGYETGLYMVPEK
jgi:hypothetical protein